MGIKKNIDKLNLLANANFIVHHACNSRLVESDARNFFFLQIHYNAHRDLYLQDTFLLYVEYDTKEQ